MSENAARSLGLVLAPCRPLRYGPGADDPGAVTAPPYDVLDAETVPQLLDRHPHNIVRLSLPAGSAGRRRTRRWSGLLDDWQAAGGLRLDQQPGLYVYEYRWDSDVVRGLIAALGLLDFTERTVLPYEDVLPPIVEERTELISHTATNLDPILLGHAGCLRGAGRRRGRPEAAA